MTSTDNVIKEALNRTLRLRDKELDCFTLAHLVGYWIETHTHARVKIIGGETQGNDADMDIHGWVTVNGKIVDPFVTYYGLRPARYIPDPDGDFTSDVCGPNDNHTIADRETWQEYLR